METHNLDRRSFLSTMGASAAALTLSPSLLSAASPEQITGMVHIYKPIFPQYGYNRGDVPVRVCPDR